MLKEYFVVARYVASVPEGMSFNELVLGELVRDIQSTSPNQMENLLKSMFTVIEGEEMDSEED